MATEEQEIRESDLVEVFTELKGSENRLRTFVDWEDFQRACYHYKPPCLRQLIFDASTSKKVYVKMLAVMEDHFRNMCESGSPAIATSADPESPMLPPAP